MHKISMSLAFLVFVLGGLSACSEEEVINPAPSSTLDIPDAPLDGQSVPLSCACVAPQNECVYVDCVVGQCKNFPRPQGTPCAVGEYPSKTCNGLGACAYPAPAPGCVTATGTGDAASGCDDGNPCTQDYLANGACQHNFKGIGTACGQNGQSDGVCRSGGVGEQCCPVAPATELAICGTDGVQDACAFGSVCLGGQCWISCDPVGSPYCSQQSWKLCAPKTVGAVTAYICQ